LLFGAGADATNYAGIVFGAPSLDPTYTDPHIWIMSHAFDQNKLIYGYHDGGTDNNDFYYPLTLDMNSRVGINTTDPRAALHVKSNNIRLEGHSSTGTNSPQLEFREDGSNSYWAMIKRGSNRANQPDNLLLSYNVDGTATGWTEHMRFDTQGNVIMNRSNLNVTSGGNITIHGGNLRVGTTDDTAARLHVRGSRWPAAIIEGGSASGSGSPVVAFKETNSDPYWIMSKRGSEWPNAGDPVNNNLIFSYCASVDAGGTCTDWREHMRFDTNENAIFGGNVTLGGQTRSSWLGKMIGADDGYAGQTGNQACQAEGLQCVRVVSHNFIREDANCPGATHCSHICDTEYNTGLQGVVAGRHDNIHSCNALLGEYSTYLHVNVLRCNAFFNAICN